MAYAPQPGGGWGPVRGGGGWGSHFGGGWRSHLDHNCSRKLLGLALGAAAIGVGVKLYALRQRRLRREKWAKAGKDVVVLHTYPRCKTCPNISPYALKIETYCRMAGVTYVIDLEEPMGTKNKSPWITINGVEVMDSELILDYLEKHFNRPLPATVKLTPEQAACGRSVQVMLDEHTMGLMGMKRYIIDNFEYVRTIVPKKLECFITMYRLFFMRGIRQAFYIRGEGRFTEQEVLFFLYRDLQALADTLGKKSYLLGTEPTVYDAAAFANLTQALCATAPEVELQVRQKHDNLVCYFDRIKSKFWSDWDQVCDVE